MHQVVSGLNVSIQKLTCPGKALSVNAGHILCCQILLRGHLHIVAPSVVIQQRLLRSGPIISREAEQGRVGACPQR